MDQKLTPSAHRTGAKCPGRDAIFPSKGPGVPGDYSSCPVHNIGHWPRTISDCCKCFFLPGHRQEREVSAGFSCDSIEPLNRGRRDGHDKWRQRMEGCVHSQWQDKIPSQTLRQSQKMYLELGMGARAVCFFCCIHGRDLAKPRSRDGWTRVWGLSSRRTVRFSFHSTLVFCIVSECMNACLGAPSARALLGSAFPLHPAL
jgi:hypothetical protein